MTQKRYTRLVFVSYHSIHLWHSFSKHPAKRAVFTLISCNIIGAISLHHLHNECRHETERSYQSYLKRGGKWKSTFNQFFVYISLLKQMYAHAVFSRSLNDNNVIKLPYLNEHLTETICLFYQYLKCPRGVYDDWPISLSKNTVTLEHLLLCVVSSNVSKNVGVNLNLC